MSGIVNTAKENVWLLHRPRAKVSSKKRLGKDPSLCCLHNLHAVFVLFTVCCELENLSADIYFRSISVPIVSDYYC